MFYRDPWRPILAVSLATAFLIVSWLVVLMRGHPWLIKRKLKLGALLLGINGAVAGCDRGGFVTCYAPAPYDWVHFDTPFATATGLLLDLSQGNALTGSLSNPSRSSYSFQLIFEDEESQRGEIVAADGAFDEGSEDFFLSFATDNLPPKGILRLHRCAAADIGPHTPIDEFRLTVVNRP